MRHEPALAAGIALLPLFLPLTLLAPAAGRVVARSGVNNTARQAGGAVGIAAFGAVAGSASNARVFVSGLHLSGLVAALLFLVAGLSTVLMRSN